MAYSMSVRNCNSKMSIYYVNCNGKTGTAMVKCLYNLHAGEQIVEELFMKLNVWGRERYA